MEKKQDQQKGSDLKQHFWVTCKYCRKKLAIPPDWVFKYLERVQGYEREEKVEIPT